MKNLTIKYSEGSPSYTLPIIGNNANIEMDLEKHNGFNVSYVFEVIPKYKSQPIEQVIITSDIWLLIYDTHYHYYFNYSSKFHLLQQLTRLNTKQSYELLRKHFLNIEKHLLLVKFPKYKGQNKIKIIKSFGEIPYIFAKDIADSFD